MKVFELEGWLAKRRVELDQRGIKVLFTQCEPTDNSAVYFDIDTHTTMARAIVWESMGLDLEAIELATGKKFISETHQAQDVTGVLHILSDFFARLEES